MERGDEEAIASANICENTSKIEHMQSDEAENAVDSGQNATSTDEKTTIHILKNLSSKEDHIQNEKDDNAVVSGLHTNATEENISSKCSNVFNKEDHIQNEKDDNVVVSGLHTNATEENISKSEKTEKDVAETKQKTVTFGSPTVNEEILKNIVLECDSIRNEDIEEDNPNPEKDGEQEPVLQETSIDSTISIQKSVPENPTVEAENTRVPQPIERIRHTLKFTPEGVQKTTEEIPIKRKEKEKIVLRLKIPRKEKLNPMYAAYVPKVNEAEKLDISNEIKYSEKLEENTKEPQKVDVPQTTSTEKQNAETEPEKTEEKKEEIKADTLKLPPVTTHSNELEPSSLGTKPIIEENADDELEIAIQVAIAESLKNTDSKDGSKKENEDENSQTNEQEEVLVETDNEETDDEKADDDDDHKQRNENNEREKPRSAPRWENVKKSTLCPMEKKDSGEEEHDADDSTEGDENENTDGDDDENTDGDEDENTENDENKSENLKSPARYVGKKVEDEVEDPVEQNDEETDDDILLSQFKVATTEEKKKEKDATNKNEEEKDDKNVAKKGKGVVQKKAAKALGRRTPTEVA
ncbi:uncharacterized protein [Spinacia oleracea]|uniref:Uncharacterized protein n=1 Tax=Spinacia oleracea TaxID=3562 RepID=A0ABM3RIP7_SPIOL|nr:uncharacterized protein LOC110790417 [Spinacia oleracea]